MKLSREEVLHIARLARLGLSDEEIERAREQLSDILESFEVLRQVDTGDVPPTAHFASSQNVLRGDEPCDSYPRDEILTNAPRREDDSFKVRGVLE